MVTGTTAAGSTDAVAAALGAGARNTSGGRVADDDSSAHVAPSGEICSACAPGVVVSRVRGPPSTGNE